MIRWFVLHIKGYKVETGPQQQGKVSLFISMVEYKKFLLQLLQNRQIKMDLSGMPVEHVNQYGSSI
jgi:hypothetical protein